MEILLRPVRYGSPPATDKEERALFNKRNRDPAVAKTPLD
jgi:hypothetical protein